MRHLLRSPLILAAVPWAVACTDTTTDADSGGDGHAPGPKEQWCGGSAAHTPDGAGFDTVQGAVDAAQEGATVTVCPGTWVGKVRISQSVRLVPDRDAETVLDAGGDGATVAVYGGEVELNGLTLTGGAGLAAPDGPRRGGCLFASGGIALGLERVVLRGCTADEGGAAYVEKLSYGAWMDGVEIRESSATDAGGGIALVDLDGASLTDLDLEALQAARGGGIAVRDAGKVQLFDSRLAGLTADAGGGLWAEATELQLEDIQATGNTPDDVATAAGSFSLAKGELDCTAEGDCS